jgi:hypothetical protein
MSDDQDLLSRVRLLRGSALLFHNARVERTRRLSISRDHPGHPVKRPVDLTKAASTTELKRFGYGAPLYLGDPSPVASIAS